MLKRYASFKRPVKNFWPQRLDFGNVAFWCKNRGKRWTAALAVAIIKIKKEELCENFG